MAIEVNRLYLPTDQNENSGRQRQDSHDYRWNGDAGDECHYANENEINCK